MELEKAMRKKMDEYDPNNPTKDVDDLQKEVCNLNLGCSCF